MTGPKPHRNQAANSISRFLPPLPQHPPADPGVASNCPAPRLRALELFCGIGGFAAAVKGSNLQVVLAIDQSQPALEVYRLNFPGHPALAADLEKVQPADLLALKADLWWLSPPCQPYSVKGIRRDLDDPRAASLLRLIELLGRWPQHRLPRHLALENVAGFSTSKARKLLLEALTGQGYRYREEHLCPTACGVPSRRPRYYLTATIGRLAPHHPAGEITCRSLASYLEPREDPTLFLDPELVGRFSAGLRILDPADDAAYTTCFTSSYGRSLMHSGSYLRSRQGVRYFSPEEIARLLHFPAEFRFPEGLSLRKRWQQIGNSLSVAAVRRVLKNFPGFDVAAAEPAAGSSDQPR